MMRYVRFSLFSSVALCASLTGLGAHADGHLTLPEQCEVRFEEKFISVLLCEPDLDERVLSDAGKAACQLRLPCGAWIWTDAENLPTVAPQMHDDLTQEQVTSSVGVWVAEQDILISIDKSTQ